MEMLIDARGYPVSLARKCGLTSQEAARIVETAARNLRDVTWAAIASSGRHGMTSIEVANMLNKPVRVVRPRLVELLARQRVRVVGTRKVYPGGTKVNVYVAVDGEGNTLR